MTSLDPARVLWVQDRTTDSSWRACVERPEFADGAARIPMGVDGAWLKRLAPDEALSMAHALITAVKETLGHTMEPEARRRLEGQLDGLVSVTQNALRWRTMPRRVTE